MFRKVRLPLLILLLAVVLTGSALAQEAEATFNYPDLFLATDFPAQVVGIGETVTLKLELRSATEPQIVALNLRDLPEGWNAAFRGSGRTVSSVLVAPDVTVDLRVEVPADVESGRYTFTVEAEGEGVQASLPLTFIIEERVPASLALTSDLPMQRGRPSTTFRYNVTLRNDGDDDITVDLTASPPPFFNVVFKSGTSEVTSIPLGANESERLSVEVQPLVRIIPADVYPITVRAQSEDLEATIDLMADVVGEADLTLTTPDGRLSGSANAGAETTFKVWLQNTGTAAARNIELTSTTPNGWTVTFQPEIVDVVEAGAQVEVEAIMRPSEQAVAGDYIVNVRARPEGGAQKSLEYRVTVYTSTLWGVAGVGLIALAVAVVGFAVSRFGRR